MTNPFAHTKYAVPIPKGRQPADGQLKTPETRYHLRVGEVIRVDYVNWCVDVVWLDGVGARSEVPLTVAGSSYRCFAGFMPEEHSLVVCGFLPHSQQHYTPVVLAYLPCGVTRGYDFNPLKHIGDQNQLNPSSSGSPGSDNPYDPRQIRCKMQKVYPGEGFMQSSPGTWIRLDHHFRAFASDLSGLWINAHSHSLFMKSLSHVVRTAMGRTREGLIIRNGAPELKGVAPVDPIVLYDQKQQRIITVDNTTIDAGGIPWAEYRQLIRETTQPILDITEEFEEDDQIYTINADHLIEHCMGTLVGDFPADTDRYGQVLRYVIFTDPYQVLPTLNHVVITDSTPKKQLAEAYHLQFLKTQLYGSSLKRSTFTPVGDPAASNDTYSATQTEININKEGKLQANITASSDLDPLGAGRSAEVNLDGSIKLTIGSNANQQQSVVIDTSSGWLVHINGPDVDGYALRLYMKGNVDVLVDGNLNTLITGNETRQIYGNLKTIVNGNETREVDGNISTTIGGDDTVKVGGKRVTTIGKTETRQSGDTMQDSAPAIQHN